MIKEAINILLEIRAKITDDSDLMYSSFETAHELRTEIDDLILRLQQDDKEVVKDIYVYFLPTSTFQEHSLQNHWSSRYIELAERFDKIYEQYK